MVEIQETQETLYTTDAANFSEETVAEELAIANPKPYLSITEFIDQFGESLLEAVSDQHPAVYNGEENGKRAAVLNSLKRKPFPAQQKVVQAVTRLLMDEGERAAIINSDMGTGKSIMGIATAAVLAAEGLTRTLILSPPHLVYKWRREILETIPDARVWILNGADTLVKLIRLRDGLRDKKQDNDTHSNKTPEFFILGRVRLRLGFHWKPAFMVRKKHYVACPKCGEYVRDRLENPVFVKNFPMEKRYKCLSCSSPLWTSIRSSQSKENNHQDVREMLKKSLCKIPTIGKKRAEQLLMQFGESFLSQMLSDNVHQFINLMDESGKLVFSDRQAQRMERAFAKLEFSFGQGNYQASEYIKRFLPKNYFSLLIVDEGHEYKSLHSAQGQAMGVIASQVQKVLLLTGTLMGGYADDLFFLLWRCLSHRLQEDGYRCRRGSLNSAAMAFMEHHGILKRIFKKSEESSYKTSRAKKVTERTSKAPGFGPKGVARYVLPYTAFLKLHDISENVLPPYEEHCIEVEMTEDQALAYEYLERTLSAELKKALRKGDITLLGVIMNCLLAWPDCCFREEHVVHPRTKRSLIHLSEVLGEEASPKEQEMIRLCKEAKAAHRRTLVYTTYTGTRDTAARLKTLLEAEGFKTAILRSSVEADKREDWIFDQLERGIDILICNPELVKTGLDLLEFPNILFMQSGYSTYTLMQASRRSWRIGQKLPVNVYFLGYQNTAQIECLKLMAKKIAVSQSTSGTMPDTGLDVLSQEADSIEVALAKQLISAI